MAYPNEIQVGRYNLLLHKLLAMEEGAPAPQLTGEIVPCIVLENDRPEYRVLGGVNSYLGGGLAAAVVGELGETVLFNPVGSGVLVILQWAACTLSTNSNIELRNHAVVPAGLTPIAAIAADRRQDGFPAAQLQSGTSVATGGTRRALAFHQAGRTPFEPVGPGREPVLIEGTGLGFATNAANIGMQWNYYWTERKLEESES
jgi:hypothetical protein